MRLTLLLLLLNAACLGWGLLVHEPSALPRVRSVQATPASLRLLDEANSAGEVQGARCYVLGTFAATADSDRFVNALRELGYQAQVILQEVEAAPDYWVHLPPFVSEALALRRLEELKGRGVDSYLITGGDLALGISLGLFSRREDAERLRGDIQALGYEAGIRELPRRYGEIWVSLRGIGKGAGWEDLLRQYPGLRQVEKSCETIAKPNEFP